MEIWTKEELYKLKGECWKAPPKNAKKKKKSPTQQRRISLNRITHSRLNENTLVKFLENNAFLT